MFDSHDDDLWEVPSIDVDVPVEAAEEVVPAAEAEAAAPVEPAAAAEDESSTDGYDQAAAEATTWMGWTANCSSTLLARSCART